MAYKHISLLDRIIFFILHNYGLYPNPTNGIFYKIFSYIFHFSFPFLYCCSTLAYAFIYITDSKRSTDGLCSSLCVAAFIVKMINFRYYYKRISNLVDQLYELQVFESAEEIAKSKENTRFISAICYIFWGFGHLTVFVGSFKGFRKENPEMVLVCWYPWDWEHNTTAFWILWLYSLLSSISICHVNITLDIFSSFLMDTIATQFDVLGMRLQKLGENIKDYRKELDKLIACMKHYQHLLELVEEMESFLSIQFFVQIILSGIIFCSGVYQMTSLDMPRQYLQFLYCTVLMGCIASESFSYTYFGNRILTSTDNITNCAYFSPWYEMPVYYRKYLILLMERAKMKSVIRAGKLFEMNLALFTTIMRFSHRLYALRSSVAHK